MRATNDSNGVTRLRAIKALCGLYADFGTWRRVSEKLEMPSQHGYIRNVARGERPPSDRLLVALKIRRPRRARQVRYKRIQEMSARELRAAFENRTEVTHAV